MPYLRDYFAVVGGKEPRAGTGHGGAVYLDGLFNLNHWYTFADIADGSSNTFAFGESVHPAFRGANQSGPPAPEYPPYTRDGGTVPWWHGGECYRPCNVEQQEYGMGYRSTKNPINSDITPLYWKIENESPFGSYHNGGAYFSYADGHVGFINDTIDMKLYWGLSTTAGGEMISSNAF